MDTRATMQKMLIALVALVLSAAALADDHPVAEFKRDNQIVKIVPVAMLKVRAVLTPVMNEKVDGKVRSHKYGGKNMYWFRVRSIDGREQCEKFTVVSPGSTEKEIADRAEELFRESCS